MQWKSASRAIKCHCDLAWDVSPSLKKNAQWTIEKEDNFKCFSVSLVPFVSSVVVGLTFLSLYLRPFVCFVQKSAYHSRFYQLYGIKFHYGFGGLSHHCLRDYLCEIKSQSFSVYEYDMRNLSDLGSWQGTSQTFRILELSLLYSWFGSSSGPKFTLRLMNRNMLDLVTLPVWLISHTFVLKPQ